MKLAFVCQPLDSVRIPEKNSVGIWTSEIARRLATDHQVTLFAADEPFYRPPLRWQPQVDHSEGITYRYLPLGYDKTLIRPTLLRLWKRIPQIFHSQAPEFARNGYAFGYALQVALALRQDPPDIVHIHNFSQFIPIIRYFNPTVKIVIHMHCEWLNQLDPTLIRPRLSQAHLILGCSDFITNRIRQAFPDSAPRCQTLYNGISDIRHFPPRPAPDPAHPQDPKHLLYVGRIAPEKGIHILLQAFQQLVEQDPSLQLTLVGGEGVFPYEFIIGLTQDPVVAALKDYHPNDTWLKYLQHWQQSALNSHLCFTGHVPYAQISQYYQKADLFVYPTILDEPFGMGIVEAMAAECPVVASKVGGIVESVVDRVTGVLIERNDPTGLAQAIQTLLKDPAQCQRMGQAGRQRVLETFTFDQIAQTLLKYYSQLFTS